MHRLQLEDLVAHRLDDLPAAERRAHRHGERADALDPEGNRNRVNFVENEKGEGDHAHGLLGIVEAVARRHESGGNDLQLGEGAGELVAVGPGAQEHDQKHGQEAHAETGEGRQDQRKQDLFGNGSAVERAETGVGHGGSHQAADERVG